MDLNDHTSKEVCDIKILIYKSAYYKVERFRMFLPDQQDCAKEFTLVSGATNIVDKVESDGLLLAG